MLGSEPARQRGPNNTDTWTTEKEGGFVSVAYPLVMMITGVVGNALSLLLVSRSYLHREGKGKKSFLLCIGGLALTELAGKLLTSPVVIAVYLSRKPWQQLDPSGHLCDFFGLTMTVVGICTLFISSIMAVKKMLAIRAPHWYSIHLKTGAARAVLLAVWLAGLAFALLPMAIIGHYSIQWPGTWCFISIDERGTNTTTSVYNLANVFFASTYAFLGLTALVVTFVCTLATIKALVSRCRTKATVTQEDMRWVRITTETVIQLMGIVCVNSACWSPLLILMLKIIFNQISTEHCKMSNSQVEIPKDCDFFLTAIRLASLNQILDPSVYLLLRKMFLCQVANTVSKCSPNGQKV
ncbi:prostaglandin E2 receptor EP3 subtype-like [Gracilinanus agilis]|uniref:prostaglandin E2 receptor EP3 subtype-like n=1 Tax=Gracilinanus agilis TaxID=191870 RepID=UPI001CFE2E2F|nr:prostaglandin E2 receptor EP3 subtype-like [Gracilinanus agilis]